LQLDDAHAVIADEGARYCYMLVRFSLFRLFIFVHIILSLVMALSMMLRSLFLKVKMIRKTC
jgi:hypothetical protein